MKCPKCNYENKNTNIRCENCDYELQNPENLTYDVENSFYKRSENKIELTNKSAKIFWVIFAIIMFGPFVLFSLVFLGVGLFNSISDNNMSKDYVETTGTLIDYVNCRYDDDTKVCDAVYEYVVDGEVYKATPNMSSNNFSKSATIKYNPNNPSEYVMNSGWSILIIVGLVMFICFIIVLIIITKLIKKFKKNNE